MVSSALALIKKLVRKQAPRRNGAKASKYVKGKRGKKGHVEPSKACAKLARKAMKYRVLSKKPESGNFVVQMVLPKKGYMMAQSSTNAVRTYKTTKAGWSAYMRALALDPGLSECIGYTGVPFRLRTTEQWIGPNTDPRATTNKRLHSEAEVSPP